jgi:hypothetical protein
MLDVACNCVVDLLARLIALDWMDANRFWRAKVKQSVVLVMLCPLGRLLVPIAYSGHQLA